MNDSRHALAALVRLAIAVLALLGAAGAPALAQPGGRGTPGFPFEAQTRKGVDFEVHPSKNVLRPGDQFVIAVVLDHASGWHSWPSEAQDVLPPAVAEFAWRTSVALEQAPEWAAIVGDPIWPEPHGAKVANPEGGDPIELPTYSERAIAYIPMVVRPDAPSGAASVAIKVSAQACDDTICLNPKTETFTINLLIAPLGQTPTDEQTAGLSPIGAAANFTGFDQARVFSELVQNAGKLRTAKFDVFGWKFEIDPNGAGFALLLIAAMAGGLILNVTPCVLPVIPIKIMSLAKSSDDPKRAALLGAVMSLGVVAFWMALGGVILSVKGFTATNQLFQYPAFTIGVGVVILLMALGMFGVYNIVLPQAVYSFKPKKETLAGAFLFGVFTAVLSTPCTAPFMGAAMAWASTVKNAGLVLATFLAIGVGMALPYLVLSARPALVSRIPRTGPASELVKHMMGLLLIAVAAFFVGSGLSGLMAKAPDPPSRLYWWVVGAGVAFAGAFLAWQTIAITKRATARAVFVGIGLLFIAAGLGIGVRLTDKGPVKWVYYTPERLAEALAQNKVVVMDFTAEWCLNCKAMEAAVLNNKAVHPLLNSEGVAPIKVDLTGKNEPGNAKLKELEWTGIPLLVVYGPGLDQPIKFDAYTIPQVLQAIEKARGAVPRPEESGR